MVTIKSFTDILQSQVLSKILPLESADMYYFDDNGEEPNFKVRNGITYYYDSEDFLCCWSLAALLSILTENKICHYNDRYYCQYISEGDEFPIYSTAEYDNPVDACYEMILKLNELNLL